MESWSKCGEILIMKNLEHPFWSWSFHYCKPMQRMAPANQGIKVDEKGEVKSWGQAVGHGGNGGRNRVTHEGGRRLHTQLPSSENLGDGNKTSAAREWHFRSLRAASTIKLKVRGDLMPSHCCLSRPVLAARHVFLFLCMPCDFPLKTGHLNLILW